ncbi:MAG TPA: hypothetical protein VGV10_03440 [Thermoleophilaceae bacterium]|nr:hypothetical protein [Thermoleophilaceae bacterium]
MGGTGHFVRYLDGTPESTIYCSLARGGSACGGQKVFTGGLPGSNFAFGRPHVFLPAPNEVIVYYARQGSTTASERYINRSTNSGVDFGPQQLIGAPFYNPDEAVFGPGNSITSISEVTTAGAHVHNSDFAAPVEGDEADLGDISAEAAIGIDAGRPVAVFVDQSAAPRIFSRAYDGSGSINSESNWTAPALIQSTGGLPEVALAGGPKGLFLVYEDPSSAADRVLARKLDPATNAFGPATLVASPGDVTDLHATQDPGGRLHVVWDDNAISRLRWSFSDDGVSWSPAATVNIGSDYRDVRVSAAADHRGFVTWESGSAVVATALEAIPDNLGGGPGPGGPDTAKPIVGNLGISDSTLAPGQSARFSFTTNEAGAAVLTIEKRVKGLKLRSKGRLRCLVHTKARLRKLRSSLSRKATGRKLAALLRKRRCNTYKAVGRIRQVVRPGANEIVFTGRLAGRRLSAGSYRARLTVRDAAGNVSRTETATFKVIRKKNRRGG